MSKRLTVSITINVQVYRRRKGCLRQPDSWFFTQRHESRSLFLECRRGLLFLSPSMFKFTEGAKVAFGNGIPDFSHKGTNQGVCFLNVEEAYFFYHHQCSSLQKAQRLPSATGFLIFHTKARIKESVSCMLKSLRIIVSVLFTIPLCLSKKIEQESRVS